MKVPAIPYELPKSLRVEPRDIPTRVAQDHVVRHVLGLAALYSESWDGRATPWDSEGWDRTNPPALDVEHRRDRVQQIGELDVQGQRCRAKLLGHETYGGAPPLETRPCEKCPDALVAACADLLRGISERYFACVAHALGELSTHGTEVVSIPELWRVATSFHLRPDRLDGLVVGTCGLIARENDQMPYLQLSRIDGVRSHFYLNSRTTLRWRTTFRDPPSGVADKLSFVLNVPRGAGDPDLPQQLSGRALVPRQWWQGAVT